MPMKTGLLCHQLVCGPQNEQARDCSRDQHRCEATSFLLRSRGDGSVFTKGKLRCLDFVDSPVDRSI